MVLGEKHVNLTHLNTNLWVVKLPRGWVWVQMGPDKWGYDINRRAGGRSFWNRLGFRRKTTPASFQAVCTDNWEMERKKVILTGTPMWISYSYYFIFCVKKQLRYQFPCSKSGTYSPITNVTPMLWFTFMSPSSSLRIPDSRYHIFVTESLHSFKRHITFLDHSDTETLLKTAELTSVSTPLIHGTVFVGKAHIFSVFLYSAL